MGYFVILIRSKDYNEGRFIYFCFTMATISKEILIAFLALLAGCQAFQINFTTEAPTTKVQTTEVKTTKLPTTEAPTTEGKETTKPTPSELTTTNVDTTEPPTTDKQTTVDPEGCSSNADCPIDRPFCHANTCYECEVDSQCHNQFCNDGDCVDCIDSSDCRDPLLPACSHENTCVECTNSSECDGAFPVCLNTTNTCVECLMDDDCGDDFPVCLGNVCDICKFQDGYIAGNYEILADAQNASECALLAKQSNEFATGASFKNVSCVATYGNDISDDAHYVSCIFPGVEEALWEMSEDKKTCVENTDQSATSTSQIHCQSLCKNDAMCIGIGCDNYRGCTEKCLICYAGDLKFDAEVSFYNKTIEA